MSPPMWRLLAGLRAWTSNSCGAFATCSRIHSGSKKTLFSSTFCPAAPSRSSARWLMNSTPSSETSRRQPRVEGGHRVRRRGSRSAASGCGTSADSLFWIRWSGSGSSDWWGAVLDPALGKPSLTMWATSSTSWECLLETPWTGEGRAVKSDAAVRSSQSRAPRPASSQGGTQAVDRAAALLTYVVEADHPVTFAEATEAAGLARSTTSRLLAALERTRLLERSAPGSTSVARCSCSTPPGTTATPSWPGWPSRCSSRSARTPARTCTSRSPTGQRRPHRPGRLDLPARRPRLDRRRDPAALLGAGQGAAGVGRARRGPSGPPRDAHRAHARAPGATSTCDLAQVRARGFAITRDELEVGLAGVAAPVFGTGERTWSRPWGSPDPRRDWRTGSTQLGRLLKEQTAELSTILRHGTHSQGPERDTA